MAAGMSALAVAEGGLSPPPRSEAIPAPAPAARTATTRTPPTAADIEALRQELQDEIENGSDPRKKPSPRPSSKNSSSKNVTPSSLAFTSEAAYLTLDPQPPDNPDGNDETLSDESFAL